MGLPQLKTDDEVAGENLKQGLFDKILQKSLKLISPKHEVADDYKELNEEQSEKVVVKNKSKLERKIHAPMSELETKIQTHVKTDTEKASLATSIKDSSESKLLKNDKLGQLVTKITGTDLEKDVKMVQKIAGDDVKLKRILDSGEKINNIKDKLKNSFFGKIFGFFGKTPEIKPEDLWDNKKKKIKSFWRYIKEKPASLGFVSATFIYGIAIKYKKEFLLYFSSKKIIDVIGGVIERVENLGAKASEFLKKFNPSREKIYTARKMVQKAPKVITSFLKNPKKQIGGMVEYLKKGNSIPGFAEKLKESNIKGFKFRGSGPAMIVILSQKVISEMVEEDDLENPETFAESWIPFVALLTREYPNLISSIKENGIRNSKAELVSFLLQAGFDIVTTITLVPALLAFISGIGTPASIAYTSGITALRRGGLVALRKFLGLGIKKYGQKFAQKKIRKEIIKKGASFALVSGGPIALNYLIATVIPKINEKVIETVKSQGSVVAKQLFTSQQMRAYGMYKKMTA